MVIISVHGTPSVLPNIKCHEEAQMISVHPGWLHDVGLRWDEMRCDEINSIVPQRVTTMSWAVIGPVCCNITMNLKLRNKGRNRNSGSIGRFPASGHSTHTQKKLLRTLYINSHNTWMYIRQIFFEETVKSRWFTSGRCGRKHSWAVWQMFCLSDVLKALQTNPSGVWCCWRSGQRFWFVQLTVLIWV